MSFPENEVAADNARRRMEETSKSPVGGVIEDAATFARPALVVASAVAAAGGSAGAGLVVAGSVVAGLGIVDWIRKVGTAKVNENLESLGRATEDALNRVERVLLEHGTSIDEIESRLNSLEFKEGMASASLQALRTTQEAKLKRMAWLLANGLLENDLEPEGLDHMMRAAAELNDADVGWLGEMLYLQQDLFRKDYIDKTINERSNDLQGLWQKYWNENKARYGGDSALSVIGAFTRLQSLGMIAPGPDRSSPFSPVSSCYWLLPRGKKFLERLQEVAKLD